MRNPIYGNFTHILQIEKKYIESFCYNIVENHLYTKNTIPKNEIFIGKKKIKINCFCQRMFNHVFLFLIFKWVPMSSTKDMA